MSTIEKSNRNIAVNGKDNSLWGKETRVVMDITEKYYFSVKNIFNI